MAIPSWLKTVSPIAALSSSKTARKVVSPLVLGQFKRGGKVPRTGDYKLHAGERVLTRRQTKRYDRKRSKR